MARTATKQSKKGQKRAQPVRSRRNDLNAEDHKIGQDNPRAMKSTGPALEALEPTVIEPVPDGRVSKEKLEALRFMEDVLTVVVHESTNERDDPIPAVWNNGRAQYFIRGKEQEVKRKFVEVLARLKYTTYTQRLTQDAAGNDTYVNIPHTALRYPFSVTHDPAGDKGVAWLKKVFAEG